MTARIRPWLSRVSLWLVVLALLAGLAPSVAAQEGWVIERLAVSFEIHTDTSIDVREEFDVDFRGLERRGILRDLVQTQVWDREFDRRYEIGPPSVRSADGRTHQVQVSNEGSLRRFRIGNPDIVITGRETYRITYSLDGAMNSFPNHDEFYWNAVGTWPVPIEQIAITVRAPEDSVERAQCFQGPPGSTEPCQADFTSRDATFRATRPLGPGEQLTIVAGLTKGAVVSPSPILVARPRDVTRFFDRTPGVLTLFCAGLLAAAASVAALWWRFGRDRRFVSLRNASGQRAEQRVPLLASVPVPVQFTPPDGLRPAQMGLLLDERADTLDVTATIVDLAVRGYLRIAEIPKRGWFSQKDWALEMLKVPDAELHRYERIILVGLFASGSSTKISALRNKFYEDLADAKKALYDDAVQRGWFRRNPNTIRAVTRVAALALVMAGIALTIWLGHNWGHGLAGLPVLGAGILMAALPRAMPRRTAVGHEALVKSLGFARYIRTAETHQQAFAERAAIFTEYLPFAVAFEAVTHWANAFKDIDLQAATQGWYAGTRPFEASSLSSALGSFQSSVSSSLSSTPGGSGGSGFSGGSSGGGGGGGGGGSW